MRSNASQGAEWWRGGVLYQIYPRSFHDSNGDGVGDLPGITQKLDYVASLGVDGIWISPFMKSPMKDFGYDVSDYRAVDPTFGTLEDFDRLLAKAQSVGLRVIIDMVLPHTSDQHPWFVESRSDRKNPKADWYVWAEARPDGTPPNNWLSIFGGPAWSWDGRRGQYYQHNFLPSQPTLSYGHPEVLEAMLGEMRFWLERGVAGFRIDAITCMTQDGELRNNPAKRRSPERDGAAKVPEPVWWQRHVYDRNRPAMIAHLERIRALLDEYGESFSVGEVGDVDDPIAVGASYSATRKLLHTTYNFELLGEEISLAKLKQVVRRSEAAAGDGNFCYSFSNHDVVRIVSRWSRVVDEGADTAALAKILTALLLSLRGTICLYQGEELGLPQAEVPHHLMQDPVGVTGFPSQKGRDGCRTPFPWTAEAQGGGFTTGTPWLPVCREHLDLAADVQERQSESVLARTRRFLAWRKTHPALVTGTIRLRRAPQPLVVIERRAPSQRLLAVFNVAATPRRFTLPRDGRWRPIAGHGFPAAPGDARQIELSAFAAFFAEDISAG